jgi:hypothetical protein
MMMKNKHHVRGPQIRVLAEAVQVQLQAQRRYKKQTGLALNLQFHSIGII